VPRLQVAVGEGPGLLPRLSGESFQFYADRRGAIVGRLILRLTPITIRYMIGDEQRKLAEAGTT
jgi:hypothetical protein